MDCEESLKISGKQTIREAAEYFFSQNIGAMIITSGANELYAFSNGDLFDKTQLLKLPVSKKVTQRIEQNPASKGDTTGCGDNFAGGVIASIAVQLTTGDIGKLDLQDAIAWGVASGGFACFYVGGTFIEKSLGEKLQIVEEFKNEYIKQISQL
jgi:sugar/nucleoside kinase (ribokinase family)